LYVWRSFVKNSGYGDTGFTQDGALVTQKEDVACALMARRDLRRRAAGLGEERRIHGFAVHHKLTWKYETREKGNVFQVAKLGGRDIHRGAGFERDAAAAI